MSRFNPANFEEAVANRRNRAPRPRKAMSRGKGFQAKARAAGPKQTMLGCARTRLRTAPDPELLAWGRDVKKRDGKQCQWARCKFCHNDPSAKTDPHHKALRSARPDLRLVLDNGVTVCRHRHDWIHRSEGHDEAISRGFLNERSRELAAKEGTLGVR